MRKKMLKPIGIVLWIMLVIGALFFVYSQLQQERTTIQIAPEYAGENRIALNGAFTISGTENLTPEELLPRLQMSPAMEFRLTPAGQGMMTLQTYLPLEPGKPISITLFSASGTKQREWLFQTENTFSVLSVFPADGAADVSPATSVEIQLSHQDVNVETMKNYVAVSAEMDFHIYRHNNTYILSFNGDLPAMTDIEVLVSADLPRENGETLGQPYGFTFQTGEENSRDYILSSSPRRTENALPGENILLKLEVGQALLETPLKTTVYRYPDAQAYRKALENYRDVLTQREYVNSYRQGYGDFWQADLTGLPEVMQFDAPAGTLDANNYEYYVSLPDQLEPGWYAATVQATLPSGKVTTASKLIQVSPLSVFYAQSAEILGDGTSKILAWVNSSQTGGPVEGAKVCVTSSGYSATGTTGADGLAFFEGALNRVNRENRASEEESASFSSREFGVFEVQAGEQAFFDTYGDNASAYFSSQRASNNYYAYLFSDRPVYRHTDTVKVWGLVRPRSLQTALPEELYLTVPDTEIKVPVVLSDDGTFLAEFEIDALSGYYATIQLAGGEDVAFDNALQIKLEDYVKPEYQTTSKTDRPLYALWENPEVGIDFTARYFEGTPAQGYQAVVRPVDFQAFAETELATDENGNARVFIQPGEAEEYARKDWRPRLINYGVYSDAELNAPQVQGGSFYYLYHDVMLTLSKGEDGASVTANVNRIDLTRVQTEADVLEEETLKGEPADLPLEARVHKTWYEKVPDGERYDAINKTSVTAYRYEYKDEVVDTISAVSANGVYTFAGLPKNDKDNMYYVEVSLVDTRGREAAETNYYGSDSRYSMFRSAEHNFQLLRKEGPDAQRVYAGDMMAQQFEDGETLEMYLADYETPYTDPNGRVLYFLAQDQIFEHGLVGTEGFKLPFQEAYLPNYVISGAYFDGKYVHAISPNALAFHPEKRELDVAVTMDKEDYSPGDIAEITLRVTEKRSGSPAVSARLAVAVVDESVFSIEEQTPELLRKIYSYKFYSQILRYTSHKNMETGGGGMGGGGPENFVPRVDFPDTAAFEEFVTDRDGSAKLTVKLPDNMTSWRVTALAVTKDLLAGDVKQNLTVGKDFYVSPALPPRFVQGDDIVITAHSAGRAVQPGDDVTYRCTIEGAGESYEASAKAGEFAPIRFEGLSALDPGVYNVTVAGQWKHSTDAVTLPVEVVASGIDVPVSEKISLQQASALESTTWPVTLGFYDREHELGADIISLFASQEGVRVDQRMARRYAMEQMKASGTQTSELDSAALFDNFQDLAPDYQNYRLFPYAQESELLTARIRVAAPEEYFSGGQQYTQDNPADDPSERVGTMLLESDQAESAERIRAELESGVHSLRDQIYLMLAMARAGNEEEAKARYDETVAPLIAQSTDYKGDKMRSVQRGGEVDGGATAAACMLETVLKTPSAEQLARYLAETPAVDDLYLLELLYYLRMNPLPADASGAAISYTRDGAEETADLKTGVAYRRFTKEQLAAANFRAQGDIGVNALYTSGMEGALNRENQALTLTKTVEAADGGALRQGALAKITLRLEVPQEARLADYAQLQIEDCVPTGMRYEYIDQTNNSWYLLARNGQRVSFTAAYKDAGTLVYYARCVAPGNYVVENAFASTLGGTVWGASARAELSIQS